MEYCAHARPDHTVQKKSSKLNSVTDSKQSNLEMKKKKNWQSNEKAFDSMQSSDRGNFPSSPWLNAIESELLTDTKWRTKLPFLRRIINCLAAFAA